MPKNRLTRFLSILIISPILLGLILLGLLGGCNMPTLGNPLGGSNPQRANLPTAEAIDVEGSDSPSLPETLVSFRVQVPGDTPDGPVYLSLLDEVTGLALNAISIPMETGAVAGVEPGTEGSPRYYVMTLPFAIGSVISYRYEHEVAGVRLGEHLADGSPVRYRLFYVQGQGMVDDVVSRWADTPYETDSGRIRGLATNADSGAPLPGLLVTAGGAQVFTASDGSFLLEGLPSGIHNLVGYALDGTYRTFQQGARVAVESTTPATITMQTAPMVNVVFVVKTPPETPPVVPLRIAGNLYTLGNTFSDLPGGVNALAANMPVMQQLPDGRYTLNLSLPLGADIRYKYTLGDGFWNAEHNLDGSFRLRQLIVTPQTTLVEDTIDTWYGGVTSTITFDLTVPANTPADEYVAIQFNPFFGWTEPIPMWKLGNNRWAYALYSPLNLPGNLSYRYCRNSQCGDADDAQTTGSSAAGREAKLNAGPQSLVDQVNSWVDWSGVITATLSAESASLVEGAPARGADFWAGVQLIPAYQPTWKGLLPLDKVERMKANVLVLSPTWSYGRSQPGNNPPVLEPVAGKDALWLEMADMLEQGRKRGLSMVLYPSARFYLPADEWWASAPRDAPGWWTVWFEQYRAFALHHADLAAQHGATALVLGGDWLKPALPGGLLADGTSSGVPEDAEQRWINLVQEVRSRFNGKLLWALSYADVGSPPGFISAFDETYVTLALKPGESLEQVLEGDLDTWLDGVLYPMQILTNNPVVLGLDLPSDPDMQTQVALYQTLLSAASQRDWIVGIVSSGYYPPAALQDKTSSVNGKPASELLARWFIQLRK